MAVADAHCLALLFELCRRRSSGCPQVAAREGEVVSQAGRLGKVTVATNMAGRGTDILLGGNPAIMAKVLPCGRPRVDLLLSPSPCLPPPFLAPAAHTTAALHPTLSAPPSASSASAMRCSGLWIQRSRGR